MAIRFFTSPRAAERIAAAHRFLDGAAGGGDTRRPGPGGAESPDGARQPGFVALGAADYAARVFCRERAARDGALVGAVARGLDSLALELAKPELVAAGLRGPSRAAELAVVTQVVHDAGKRGELDRFAAVADGPGLARRLHLTFSEFRAAGISPARVAAAGDATLGRLYGESAAEWERAGFADRSRVLEAAARRLDAGGGPPPGRPLVLLDPKLGEPLLRGLVSRLAERAAEVFVTCPEADRATLAAVEAMGGRPAEAPGVGSSSDRGGEAVVSAVQRRLFRAGADTPGESSGREAGERVGEGLSVIGAPGPAAEALEIARVFLREARRGVRFDRMAVLVEDPPAYVPALAEAFGRAAVPVFFETGAEPPSRAGRAFLALLDAALGGLPAEAFLEYLSLDADRRGAGPDEEEEKAGGPAAPKAPPGDAAGGESAEPGDEPSAAARLREQLVLEAGVIGGLDRWERRLERLASRLAEAERKAADDAGADDDAAGERRRRQEELARLQAEALPVLRRLSKLPDEATLGEWVEALGGLARSALRDPGPVLDALGATAPMAEFGPLALAEVRRELADRLLDARGRSPGERRGRVLVAPIGKARGLAFEVVALPGLSEGAFRSGLREDPILPDRLRREFGDDLATGPDRLEGVRLRLSLAAGAAIRRLVLSYSSLDVVEGRPQVPSYYFAEALRAALGRTPTLDEIADLAGRESAVRRGLRAPKRPEWALDRREFDLASISRALSPEEDAARAAPPAGGGSGAAAYLLRDERLAAALRQEYMRDSRTWQPADGFLRPGPEAAAALGRHRPTARAYSATGLEAYAKCPYRFYLKNIARLRPVERPAPLTQVDALTRGSLVHEVFFELGQRMRELGLTPLPAERLDEALRLLDEVFEPVAASFREEAAPEIERIWNDQLDGLRSDFRGYLEREADSGWRVVANELTFGMAPVGPADPASRRDPAVLPGGLRLRGSIDAVEEAADGKRRVTDYKSGRVNVRASEERRALFGGEALQPALYAFAQEALTGKPTEVGRLYYTTLRGQYHQTVVPTAEAEARGLLLRFTDFLERAVAEGRFPAAPNPNARYSECAYCDYLSICGPGPAAYAERKNPEGRALAEVREVRALP